jgi:hypothetical protein
MELWGHDTKSPNSRSGPPLPPTARLDIDLSNFRGGRRAEATPAHSRRTAALPGGRSGSKRRPAPRHARVNPMIWFPVEWLVGSRRPSSGLRRREGQLLPQAGEGFCQSPFHWQDFEGNAKSASTRPPSRVQGEEFDEFELTKAHRSAWNESKFPSGNNLVDLNRL